MSKRENINASLERAFKEAEKLGVILNIEPDFFIDDDHLDCIWYGGWIGSMEYKGYTIDLEVHGEVNVGGLINGVEFSYRNDDNTGAMSAEADSSLRTAFKSDAELHKALDSEDAYLVYENNNWIECFVTEPGKTECEFHTMLDYGYDILESICDVASRIEALEKEFIKSGKNLDNKIYNATAQAKKQEVSEKQQTLLER